MNELHADPLQADVAASETTSSTTYTDLATVGPAVTKTLVAGQKVLVGVGCWSNHTTTAHNRMSFAVSGASTLAAADANAFGSQQAATNNDARGMYWTVYTATNSGSHTFTAKYKTGSATATFLERRIVVKPF